MREYVPLIFIEMCRFSDINCVLGLNRMRVIFIQLLIQPHIDFF